MGEIKQGTMAVSDLSIKYRGLEFSLTFCLAYFVMTCGSQEKKSNRKKTFQKEDITISNYSYWNDQVSKKKDTQAHQM